MATSVQENHSATTVGSSGAGTSSAAHVNFVCQRCLQPLKLDRSFTTIDPYLFAELSTPLTKPAEKEEPVVFFQKDKEVTITEDENVIHKLVPPSRYALDENSQDFTLLGEAGSGSMESLSHRVKVTSFLFDFLSGQSEVDHPLCEECTDSLLDQLDHQLNITETECKDYRDFLEKLGSNSEKVDEKELDSELKHLQAEEDALQKQLEVVENERAQMAELVQKEKETEKQLDEEEERYWKEYNEQKRQLLQLEDEQRSVDNKLKYAQTQLDKLRKTNVFNSTFHIWHSGHFGTINNFRLGRLPSVPVDWNEINAAWGQTVLLLNSLARKMNLKFQRYRLVPYGNHSYIESLTDKSKELPLYGSGGFRFFWDTKFDQAMVAFLDCLQQFKEEVEKGDSSFCLPYKMEKGKIEDTGSGASYSIKIQFNSEEQWTKALKFMLTNLKWGLAWVSSQFADK